MADRGPVEAYLLPLVDAGRAVGDVPLLGSEDWCRLDRRDPRSTASVARAALRWHLDGTPAALRARLEQELAEQNWLCAWRLRRMSGDLASAEHWSAIARWTPLDELRRLRTYEPGEVA